MKKKELKRIKQKCPVLKYSKFYVLIKFHTGELTQSANAFLHDDDFQTGFDASCYHIHELQKLFKKANLKLVEKITSI